ncbi:uncharacterized protein LOC107648214 [Arachis ipaensis]|uniref:uncharacterized protein LOC107648214 n=1 Tax=Arachis ipaensis TaxID=130454 RepID=UPI0007AF5B66|nr:uncharacterized protein LOC107648214 [Arachis ipaensis]
MVKLNSQNYSIWKTLIEDMLYSKDLYDPVEGDKSKGTKSDAEWKKLNRKAVVLIRQWLDLTVCPHVDTETNTEKIWKKLKELYERKNVQNKAFLIRKLVNMNYIEDFGASCHVTSRHEFFTSYTAENFGQIKLGDK